MFDGFGRLVGTGRVGQDMHAARLGQRFGVETRARRRRCWQSGRKRPVLGGPVPADSRTDTVHSTLMALYLTKATCSCGTISSFTGTYTQASFWPTPWAHFKSRGDTLCHNPALPGPPLPAPPPGTCLAPPPQRDDAHGPVAHCQATKPAQWGDGQHRNERCPSLRFWP